MSRIKGCVDPAYPKCGAKTRAGGFCGKPKMENGRCYMHGGRLKKGVPNLAAVKHGGISSFAPVRLQGRIDAALKDAELMSMKPALAVLLVRIQDLLSATDPEGFDPKGNSEDREVWRELRETARDFGKLAQVEDARMKQAEAFVTVQQVNVLLAALIHLVRENVADTKAQQRIASGIYALTNKPALPPPAEE